MNRTMVRSSLQTLIAHENKPSQLPREGRALDCAVATNPAALPEAPKRSRRRTRASSPQVAASAFFGMVCTLENIAIRGMFGKEMRSNIPVQFQHPFQPRHRLYPKILDPHSCRLRSGATASELSATQAEGGNALSGSAASDLCSPSSGNTPATRPAGSQKADVPAKQAACLETTLSVGSSAMPLAWLAFFKMLQTNIHKWALRRRSRCAEDPEMLLERN